MWNLSFWDKLKVRSSVHLCFLFCYNRLYNKKKNIPVWPLPISIYLIDKHIVNLDVLSINSFSKNVAFLIVQQFCTGFSDIPRILVIKKKKKMNKNYRIIIIGVHVYK